MIAITGGSGFLGSHLRKSLEQAGHEFRALRREDYASAESTLAALQGCEHLIHAIGKINGSFEDLEQSNVKMTEKVIAAAKTSGIKLIIYISSVAAARCHSPYGESKARAEKIVEASGIPYIILRPAYIYGQGDRNNTSLLENTLKRYPLIPVLGGGTFKLQPVYVRDVTQLILDTLQASKQNQTYNVAGPEQVSLLSMLQILADGLRLKRWYIPIPLRPVQFVAKIYSKLFPKTRLPVKQIMELDRHEAFDISLTKQDFNFRPCTFEQGVSRMMENA